MSDANQLKKLLETLGLSAFESLVPPDLAKELEEDIAELGGADAVLTGNVPPAPAPKPYAALGFPNPPIATGELVYACTDDDNGALRSVAPVETTTRADTMDGVPVLNFTWKVNDHGLDIEFEECTRAADLRLIRYEGGALFFHSKAFVAGDQVYARIEYVGGKRHVESKKVKLPETAFTTMYALWASLAAAPIDRGWTALVHLDRKVDKHTWRYIPTRLEVVGEESITTPAGTFDCWIIDARGASGEPELNDRYWVSRGDASERVVARAHEWQPIEGSTRRYELARMRRDRDATRGTATEASPKQSPPAAEQPSPGSSAAASLQLTMRDMYAPNLDSVPMDRRPASMSPDVVRKFLANSLEDVPTIERLREQGKVPAGTPGEAIARYERERAEYEEDLRARIGQESVFIDHRQRRTAMEAVVRLESDAKRAAYVRLTLPPGVGIDLPGEDVRTGEPEPPLPLSAPLDQRRRRFVARLEPTRETNERGPRAERYTAPDGSTMAVFGPTPASRTSPMHFTFTIAFAAWEHVKPFTLIWDISAEGLLPVTGSLRIGTHVVEHER